jgi:hypothetical protein
MEILSDEAEVSQGRIDWASVDLESQIAAGHSSRMERSGDSGRVTLVRVQNVSRRWRNDLILPNSYSNF